MYKLYMSVEKNEGSGHTNRNIFAFNSQGSVFAITVLFGSFYVFPAIFLMMLDFHLMVLFRNQGRCVQKCKFCGEISARDE
jgi:hypothetical protein